jgi:hypothetical protein
VTYQTRFTPYGSSAASTTLTAISFSPIPEQRPHGAAETLVATDEPDEGVRIQQGACGHGCSYM